ncbi:MAG: DUF262 domain-containing protein [Bacteroidales bacterium]|nr:DUF262 domain-containing protein [Bacteroidales bacterium]
MALSLTAEQKSIKNLFVNEDVYVVPVYQRPYSWTNEQSIQLYNDIADAYINDQDYFVGNLVFARANNDESNPNIIDGQQRIITLWLFLKALSLLLPEMKILNRALTVESWEGDYTNSKINSLVPPNDDQRAFNNVLGWTKETTERQVQYTKSKSGKINEAICNTHVEANFICIYDYLSQFFSSIDVQEQKEYLSFFLNRIFLLPIELKGKDINEAVDKALTIFETLNNRGLNLEDADIFKARLYEKSISVGRSETFINCWSQIVYECNLLNISLDDLFRYYSHIIRGKNNIVNKEKKLRDFFINELYSPLNRDDFENVVADLLMIIDVLKKIGSLQYEDSAISTWMKIIDSYSNLYPKYAIVSYLFMNGIDSYKTQDFCEVVKSLIRYCYSMGSTTTVKFAVYIIIEKICNHIKIDGYYQLDTPIDVIAKPGRLKKGLALLAHKLRYPNEISNYYDVDILLKTSDLKNLPIDWTKENLDEAIKSLANCVVLDIVHKNIPLSEKNKYYSQSRFSEAKGLIGVSSSISFAEFKKREESLRVALNTFFTRE